MFVRNILRARDALLIFAVSLFGVTAAYAQVAASDGYPIDFTPLLIEAIPYLVAGAMGLLSALFAWVIPYLRKVGIDIEQHDITNLERAIESRLSQIALSQFEGRGGAFEYTTKNALVADVSNYLIKTTPKAVRRLKLGKGDVLQSVVEGRLGDSGLELLTFAKPKE